MIISKYKKIGFTTVNFLTVILSVSVFFLISYVFYQSNLDERRSISSIKTNNNISVKSNPIEQRKILDLDRIKQRRAEDKVTLIRRAKEDKARFDLFNKEDEELKKRRFEYDKKITTLQLKEITKKREKIDSKRNQQRLELEKAINLKRLELDKKLEQKRAETDKKIELLRKTYDKKMEQKNALNNLKNQDNK